MNKEASCGCGMKISFIWKIFKQIILYVFSMIGTVWSIMEIFTGIFPELSFLSELAANKWSYIVPAAVSGFFRMGYLLINEVFTVHKFSDWSISVKPGNILKKANGNIIIGVNSDLKTTEDVIAPSSIHMQLLKEKPENAETLKNIFESHRQSSSSDRLFFQGEVNGKGIIFLVMSDLIDAKIACTTVKQVEGALQELFEHQNALHIIDGTVYCPLLGTGQAGVSLTLQEAVLLIVKNYLKHCGCLSEDDTDKIKRLNIIVNVKQIFKIDWIALNEEIGLMIKQCKACKGLEYRDSFDIANK